ncbi:hypothetical protein TSUD_60460, partial [Trifolium subterraneum]
VGNKFTEFSYLLLAVLGTRESSMEPTCAACAMEWSIQLEKGLRSGVPVKAILQMGPHLQRWSRELEFGIVSNGMFDLVPGEDELFANTILLRLADAFRGGNPEIRLSVVRVFLIERKHRDNRKHKQCKGLLSMGRVANHIELLKRVKSVFNSGDSESKALALVLFGCWADFANDNAQIRYLILSSLVSPHDNEVRASLFAAGCFCEISDDFACITLEMLLNMMNSPAVSLPIKLAAAQVFAKFKCSYSVAKKAFKIGLEMISNSSNEDILVIMLFSLSKLASVCTLLTSNHFVNSLRVLLQQSGRLSKLEFVGEKREGLWDERKRKREKPLTLFESIFGGEWKVDFLVSFLERQLTSHVHETALRCIHFLFRNNPALKLYCDTSFEVPDGQGLSPSEYEAWKGDCTDDEMVQLKELLSDSEVFNV